MKSIITNDLTHCLICGSTNVVMHHALNGTAKRELSDQDGLIIPLCPKHHNMDSKDSVHLNPVLAQWSRMLGQMAFEKNAIETGLSMSSDDARALFRMRYGKSYL